MIEKTRKLVIVGDSAFAEVAYEYFTYDSEYEVVAFSVEKEYIIKESMLGLPIVPFEELERDYPPENYFVFVAIVYTQLNRLRTRLYKAAKEKGFAMASYISPHAFVWRNCKIGEHCFIFENNVIQPFVTIGDNVVLWSGNHIGHHSVIRENCFFSSHVVVSGFVNVGKNCFLGVNATIANNMSIGDDCLIGANALVAKSIESNSIVRGKYGEITPQVALRMYGVKE
ncbi:acetyltransferase [Heliomicrobium gestii]|uniref:acetyltransferase n=1 Tax=Heliomicrobium gestii TaxID=2699 RepID=UPI0014794858|nr:acetyltransferase [Heliomicrobium gestii]MBM7866621.1 sugar O-acyltransferase (sialic acid O-acetyltransferase NeuD family) [Heliomicrobium gestii]